MNENTQCQACLLQCNTYAGINSHLRVCDKYDSWLKTYIPPKGVECPDCKLVFINENILKDHIELHTKY